MLPSKLVLYFDGACRPKNPGGRCTYGWAVMDPTSDSILTTGYGVSAEANTPFSTNNYAEWSALIYGLAWLEEQGWKGELMIRGDSLLVIKQVIGKWKCIQDHLLECRELAWNILRNLGNHHSAKWVPREYNSLCDSLCKKPSKRSTISSPYSRQGRVKHSPTHSKEVRACLHCKDKQPKKDMPYCTPCIHEILRTMPRDPPPTKKEIKHFLRYNRHMLEQQYYCSIVEDILPRNTPLYSGEGTNKERD